MTRRQRWAYSVVVACLAGGLALGKSAAHRKAVQLRQHRAVVVGHVISTDCQEHGTVRYSFQLRDQVYERAEMSNLDCRELAPGDRLELSYDRTDPGNSTHQDVNTRVESGRFDGLLSLLFGFCLVVMIFTAFDHAEET